MAELWTLYVSGRTIPALGSALWCRDKNFRRMGQKRKLEEVDDLDCLDKPVPSAIVHGKLTSLLLIKKRRKSDFIDGRICYGIRDCCI